MGPAWPCAVKVPVNCWAARGMAAATRQVASNGARIGGLRGAGEGIPIIGRQGAAVKAAVLLAHQSPDASYNFV